MASECRAPSDRAHSPSLPCQCAKDAAASISIKADFTRILLDIAYNDRSSVTAHRSPQTLAGGDHPPARKSPWLVEVCHNPGRGARGLLLFARTRFLLEAPSAPARLCPLAHIGAPVPALRREPWGIQT